MRRTVFLVFLTALAVPFAARGAEEPPLVPVGASQVDITPEGRIRLMGYASRQTESDGVEQRLKAHALAIGSDASGPVLLITVDNCAVTTALTDEVAGRIKAKAAIPRDRIAFCATHTHCAPALAGSLPILFGGPLPPEQQEHIDRYTRTLADKLEQVAIAALADRKPGRLASATGSLPFATNRRMLKDGRWTGFGANKEGPADRSMPLLRATDADGSLRAVVIGYACHCTTLGGDFNKICGDWAGYACEAIEKAHPGVTALVVIGCGADADPQPRTGLKYAKQHGETLAHEVERLLGGSFSPLPGSIKTAMKRIDLPFAPAPPRAHWVERANQKGPVGYHARTQLERLDRGEALQSSIPYPIQTWTFGNDLAMVFLAGEVVVDYALRLKRELDPARLWVVAYSNDVPCYIASNRLIGEGG